MFKYLSDYLRFKLSNLIAGRKDYESWKVKNYSLKKVKLNNKLFAKELEQECEKREEFLTYSEFLHVDQFGKYGYHAKHKDHGFTPTHIYWAKAIAILCKDKNFSHVLEVGPGKGNLAIDLLKESKKLGHTVFWSGIEINRDFQGIIRERFKKENLQHFLKNLVSTPYELKNPKKYIVVFSYSLDSIPPEIFVNTSAKKAPPNSILGIKIKNGILEEFVLSKNQMGKKNISFKNGIYKDSMGFRYDLSTWNLFPFQRAYISIPSLSFFLKISSKISSNSMMLIIDEFRQPPTPWETTHLCLPKDLHRYKREITDLEKGYKTSGNNLLYYPMYFYTFLKFLQSGKFSSIKYEIEEKLAKELAHDTWMNKKGYYATYAFLAGNKKTSRSVYPVTFPK